MAAISNFENLMKACDNYKVSHALKYFLDLYRTRGIISYHSPMSRKFKIIYCTTQYLYLISTSNVGI